jgi:hypothetical protein
MAKSANRFPGPQTENSPKSTYVIVIAKQTNMFIATEKGLAAMPEAVVLLTPGLLCGVTMQALANPGNRRV